MTADAQVRDAPKSLLTALGSADPARRQKARHTIRDTLAVNQKSWNDLAATFQFRGQNSDKLRRLCAMLGQDDDGEFENARQKISDIMARERRTWKSFVESLFSRSSKACSGWHDPAASDPALPPSPEASAARRAVNSHGGAAQPSSVSATAADRPARPQDAIPEARRQHIQMA
jgi:hypothetical protein